MTRTFAALFLFCTAPLHAHFATRIHYAPNVVRHGQTSPVQVIVGTDGTAAKLSIKSISGITVAMVPIGKGVFTASVAAKDVLSGYSPTGVNKTMFGRVHGFDAAGKPVQSFNAAAGKLVDDAPLNLTIGVLDGNVPVVPIADLAGRQRATRRVVNIAVGAVPLLPPSDNVTNRFFVHFGGDFYDFINVVHSTPSFPTNRGHITVRSDVHGIGKPLANDTTAYGSAGKLLGVNLYPLVTYFDAGDTASSHELGHQWINNLKGVGGHPHWPLSTMAHGVMGFSMAGNDNQGGEFPFALVQTATGWKFKAEPSTNEFSDLDLYVMGFLSPEQVGTNRVLTQEQEPCNDCPVQGAVVPLNVADIIKANGHRVPNAASAQKIFRAATVVLSAEPLSDDEMRVLDYFAARGAATTLLPEYASTTKAKPFFLATKGLGQLQMSLVWPSKFPMIDTVSPAKLPPGGGTVTVNGTGFVSGSTLFLERNGVSTKLPTKLLSSTKLTGTVPSSAGVYTVIMKATNGSVKVISGLTVVGP